MPHNIHQQKGAMLGLICQMLALEQVQLVIFADNGLHKGKS